METELKCNRLTCRKLLNDTAVVTTCSHIFCVNCANELFNASRLCPACETALAEPDDVVVSSLHPTNDYKTSVLSGLPPSTILEICSRAIAFWQYQIHQENSFQQAVVRNVSDKSAQLQKQLENVVREANGEIKLLNNKLSELERDLDVERRKVRDLQDSGRERDKEYQKLKAQFDKIKRKALLNGPNAVTQESGLGSGTLHGHTEDTSGRMGGRQLGMNANHNVDINTVVGGMEAYGIQRTPITNRTGGPNPFIPPAAPSWGQQGHPPPYASTNRPRRQTFAPPQSCNTSERSDSANEMEKMLAANYQYRRSSMPINSLTGWNAGSGVTNTGGHSITAGGHSAGGINNNSIGGLNTTAHGHPGIGGTHAPPHNQRAFVPQSAQRLGKFRPAVPTNR